MFCFPKSRINENSGNEFIQIISFYEKSSFKPLLELDCVKVIKHIHFLHYLCEITSNSGIHIYLSNLNKNIGGLTDLAKKGTDGRICIPLFTHLSEARDLLTFQVHNWVQAKCKPGKMDEMLGGYLH